MGLLKQSPSGRITGRTPWDRAREGPGEQERPYGTPASPEEEPSSKAADRLLSMDYGRALVLRPAKGRLPPLALSLCIQGPFFSGKQATFITSDSQALMQSQLEP